jgi:hypothetical protein
MLSGDEAQRIAAHIAKLPGLLRERLLISEAIAPAHLRCPRRVGLGELRTYLYNEADDATGPRNGLNDRSTAGAQGRVSLYGACLRLPRPPVRFQRGGGPVIGSGAWAALARAGSGIAKLSKGPPQSASARRRLLRWGSVR